MRRHHRSVLLATVSSLALAVGQSEAADNFGGQGHVPAPLPAVSGWNGKIEPFGGTLADEELLAVRGAISFPLGYQYGLQIDGLIGEFDDETLSGVAAHLFWRDPSRALLGVYASYTHWDFFDGVAVNQLGGEAEFYWNRFTLRGVAGVESGDSATGDFVTRNSVPVAFSAPGLLTTETYDVDTDFFDQVDLKYYFTDNADMYVGHRYLGGEHALALGADFAFDLSPTTQGAVFAEARIGEDNFEGVWGGLKIHFGQTPKPMIARDREDDPNFWDALFSITNSRTTSRSKFCSPGFDIDFAGLC